LAARILSLPVAEKEGAKNKKTDLREGGFDCEGVLDHASPGLQGRCVLEVKHLVWSLPGVFADDRRWIYRKEWRLMVLWGLSIWSCCSEGFVVFLP
jgi:hypothetical protein